MPVRWSMSSELVDLRATCLVDHVVADRRDVLMGCGQCQISGCVRERD